jgi:hypothetical protein
MNYRLYTFVANLYISPLQAGLQTAHVVSELSRFKKNTSQARAFDEWATNDKTIIICAAANHKGVVDCHAELMRTGGDALGLPVAIFHEDEQSMNGMATACGVIVPEQYWNVVYESAFDTGLHDRWMWSKRDADGKVTGLKEYPTTHPEGQFIQHIKSFRLA